MSDYSLIAYFAGGIAFITSVPQLYQIVNTKKVRDLNPYFFVLHVVSDALFLTYGIMTRDDLLSISMALPCTCNTLIFGLCLYYNEETEEL